MDLQEEHTRTTTLPFNISEKWARSSVLLLGTTLVMRLKSERLFKSWSNYSLLQKPKKVLVHNSNRSIETMDTDKVDQHQVITTKASEELETVEETKWMTETTTKKEKERKSKLVVSQLTWHQPKIQVEPVSMQAVGNKKLSNNSSSKRTRKQQFLMFLLLQASKAELKITMMVRRSRKEPSKPRNPKTDTH